MEQMKNLEIIGWLETVGEISGGKMDTSECKERVNQFVVWIALLCKELLVRRVQEVIARKYVECVACCMICRILLEQDYGLNLALSKDDILLCGYKLLASLLFHILTVRKNKIYSYSQLLTLNIGIWNLF